MQETRLKLSIMKKYIFFPVVVFPVKKRLSFHKMKKGYVLEFIDTEEQVDPILIESEDQLAEELRYLIPCKAGI